MYLPDSKYVIKVASPRQFTFKGKPYVGPYIETYRGARYPGQDITKITDIKTQLVEVSAEADEEISILACEAKLAPTQEDYKKGYMMRYFQKHSVSGVIEELNREQFLERMEDLSRFRIVSCPWVLVGPLEDYYVGRYLGKGVKTRNQATIDRLEEKMRGIKLYLTDPGQYVVEKIDLSKVNELLK